MGRWLAALAVVTAGCGNGAPTPVEVPAEPVSGGTVVIATLSDVQSWNPYLADDELSEEVLSLLYPSLAVEQADYRDHPPSFEPNLASAWSVSDDGLELTFELEPDARWSDGEAVTADDVVFTWRVQTAPEVAWTASYIKDAIESVEALGPHTVRFRFRYRYPYQLMDANDGLIVPEHVFAAVPFDEWEDADWAARAVSAGPFAREAWRPQQEVVLARNPSFWRDGRPRLDRIVLRVVASKEGALNLLLTGGADLIRGVPPEDAARVEADPRLRLVSFPDRGYSYVAWNTRRPQLADPQVRRALGLAIDRRALVDAVLHGHGAPAVGPVLTTMWAFHDALEPMPHDPAAAVALLEAAGWVDRDGDGVRDRDGEPLAIELMTNSENEVRQDMCVLIEQNLERIGADVTTRFVEWGSMLSYLESGRFDAALSRWVEPTQVDLEEVWHSTDPARRGFNYPAFADPEVDRLLAEVAEIPRAEDQQPLLARIQEIVVDQQPYAFLVEHRRLVGVDRRLRDAEINDAALFLNVGEWWVAPR